MSYFYGSSKDDAIYEFTQVLELSWSQSDPGVIMVNKVTRRSSSFVCVFSGLQRTMEQLILIAGAHHLIVLA